MIHILPTSVRSIKFSWLPKCLTEPGEVGHPTHHWLFFRYWFDDNA